MGINNGSQTIGLRKSVGSLTYYSRKGQTISRVKVTTNTSRTDLQMLNRAIQKAVGHLTKRMLEALKLGFTMSDRRLSAANVFVRENRQAITPMKDEETGLFSAIIDYSKLKLGDGDLFPPLMTLEMNVEKGSAEFTLLPPEEGGRLYADDTVYAVIYDKKQELCWVHNLGKRSEPGKKSVRISTVATEGELEFYAFAVNQRRRMSSPSVYLTE